MPVNNGIRPDDGERLAGFRKQLADPTQNHPVDGQKWHPTGPTSSQHDDLLPQHQNLGFQRRARSEQIDDNPKIMLQRSNILQRIIQFCVSRQLAGIYDRGRGLKCPLCAVVSTGRRNTSSLREKMECTAEGSAISSWFHRGREDGAVESLGERGIAESAWASF